MTHNQESLVNLLLELGANPLVGDTNGQNSVMRACEYGHLQSLQAMAVRGVNAAGIVNACNMVICINSNKTHALMVNENHTIVMNITGIAGILMTDLYTYIMSMNFVWWYIPARKNFSCNKNNSLI